MREPSREALGLYVSCLMGIAFLASWEPLHVLLNSGVGLVLGIGTFLGAILFMIFQLRQGKAATGLLALFLVGSISFGSIYGVMWYFTTYLPTSGEMQSMAFFMETPSSVRDSFMTELKAGRFTEAYDLLSLDAQNQIASSKDLEHLVQSNNWQPASWKWTKQNISQEKADFEGSAAFVGNKEGTAHLWLVKINKRWKISSISLQPN